VACLEEDEASSEEPSLSTPEFEPGNPYKGLRAFTQKDAADFFGRDRLIEELVERVKSMLTSGQPGTPTVRLLAVIGPSGSGKSSVVMAGLLPQLQRVHYLAASSGYISNPWCREPTRWRHSPSRLHLTFPTGV